MKELLHQIDNRLIEKIETREQLIEEIEVLYADLCENEQRLNEERQELIELQNAIAIRLHGYEIEQRNTQAVKERIIMSETKMEENIYPVCPSCGVYVAEDDENIVGENGEIFCSQECYEDFIADNEDEDEIEENEEDGE